MPGAGVASQSIWRSGWRKPQRRRREVSFTHEIVLVPQQLPLPHRDPADRFLRRCGSGHGSNARHQRHGRSSRRVQHYCSLET
jgi:hypothetical protein